MYHATRRTHLASKDAIKGIYKHFLTQECFASLNPKWRQDAAAKSADKVFVGLSFRQRLDKRAWHGQDYSVCRRLEHHVLWVYCMFRPFVSTPPTTVRSPCFQVRQNGKSFIRKTSSTHQTLRETIPGSKCRLMNHPFECFSGFSA